MNKQLLLILALFSSFAFASFKASKVITPPGTVHLENNLYIDETEISNFAYQEFLYYLKTNLGESSPEYNAAQLPLDTKVIYMSDGESIPLKTYAEHPAFRHYPVVYVTWEQALAYCNWRTRVVNEMFYMEEHKVIRKDVPDNIQQFVKYRLPTEAEWNKAAAMALDVKAKKRLDKHNETNIIKDGKVYNGYFSESSSTYPEYNYGTTPNEKGLYHMYGNVSEMLDEKGTSIGGNFTSSINHLSLSPVTSNKVPSKVVGFRCVAEVL